MTSKPLTKIQEISSEIRNICQFWYCFGTQYMLLFCLHVHAADFILVIIFAQLLLIFAFQSDVHSTDFILVSIFDHCLFIFAYQSTMPSCLPCLQNTYRSSLYSILQYFQEFLIKRQFSLTNIVHSNILYIKFHQAHNFLLFQIHLKT